MGVFTIVGSDHELPAVWRDARIAQVAASFVDGRAHGVFESIATVAEIVHETIADLREVLAGLARL